MNNVQLGYYAAGGGGGSSMGQSMSAHAHGGGNIHGSHQDTGYTTPNDVSGLLTPEDLDLPLDFGAFDDFPVTDSLFTSHPSHPPSVPTSHTPHTYHHTAQASHQPQHQPLHPSHGHSSHGKVVFCFCDDNYHELITYTGYPYQSYNPPSPAVMETAPGGQWFDSDL